MTLRELPDNYTTSRTSLQRIATHLLARRRAALCGKIGLRATPGGFGTPACGPDHEVVRIAGTLLIRELAGSATETTRLDLRTATLADAASLIGIDLDEAFDAGHDTPALGDPTAPIALDPAGARRIHEWFEFGWAVLDSTLGALGPHAEPSIVQLWPEHFDAGCDVAATPELRVNLGASPGDTFSPEPYLYVGPWDTGRPGDTGYWNAPFGAVLGYEALREATDPVETGRRFLLHGVSLLAAAAPAAPASVGSS